MVKCDSVQGYLVLQIRFICVYTFLCRSELRSRYFGKTINIYKRKAKSKSKTNSPGFRKNKLDKVIFFGNNMEEQGEIA